MTEIQKRHSMLGAKVVGGFSSSVAPEGAEQGNFIVRENLCLSSSGSISDAEMAFMLGLCEVVEPRRILVIGNSYGLSTLFLALANPEGLVVAIDKFRTNGLQFTEKLCEGLKVNAIQASTPDQLDLVVNRYLDGCVDLVLVDAVHENEIQTAEFRILARFLSESAAVVFHDVLSCDLLPSIRELDQEFPDHTFAVLPKTTSGLAVGYTSKNDALSEFLGYYQAEPQLVSDFQSLLTTSWGNHRTNFFEGNERSLEFPPHPQT
jgi:predicted O-methyltransferase YrrM